MHVQGNATTISTTDAAASASFMNNTFNTSSPGMLQAQGAAASFPSGPAHGFPSLYSFFCLSLLLLPSAPSPVAINVTTAGGVGLASLVMQDNRLGLGKDRPTVTVNTSFIDDLHLGFLQATELQLQGKG